jgi:hypothetical protein
MKQKIFIACAVICIWPAIARAQPAPTLDQSVVKDSFVPMLQQPFRLTARGHITVRSSIGAGAPVSEVTRDASGTVIQVRRGISPGDAAIFEMVQSRYRYVQAGAQVGLLAITRDPEFQSYKSNQSFSFKTFGDVGLIDKVTVSVTEAGKQYLLKPDDASLVIPGPKVDSFRVVKTEYRRIGVNSYAIVFFTFHSEYSDAYRTLISVNTTTLIKDDRKGISLWVFDVFSNKWKFASALDLANADADFTTNSVQTKVMTLSGGSPR